MLRRTIGLGIVSGTIATAYSVYDNDFNIDSVGIVRFSRATATVSSGIRYLLCFISMWSLLTIESFNFQGLRVMYHYKTTLYAPSVEKSSPNYQEIRSKVLTLALTFSIYVNVIECVIENLLNVF